LSNLSLKKLQLLPRYFIRKHITSRWGTTEKQCNIGGYLVDVDIWENIQKSMYLNWYEPDETEWVKSIIGPGMTVVDVGSSFGYYSFVASGLVGETGRVYSFEPSKPAYDSFVRNVKKNNIKNINAYQMGLGDSENDLELFDSLGTSVNTLNIHAPTFLPQVYYPVNDRNMGLVHIMRLDNFWEQNNLGNIDLVKIDVEGFERNVLVGMGNLFRNRTVKHILIEYMQATQLFSEGTESDFMHRLLTGYGFEIIRKKQHSFHREDGAFIMGNFLYKLVV